MTLMFKAHDGSMHDFDALPEASRNGMINRAVAHIFGNEVASQVVGKIRATIAGDNGKAADVTSEAVSTYRKANPKIISDWTVEFQAEKLAAILAGQLGVRATGTGGGVDPLVKEIRRIAADEFTKVLAGVGLKMPRGENTITLRGQVLDRDACIDRWLAGVDPQGTFGPKGAANKDRIEKAAEANLRRDAAAAKKASELNTDADAVAAALGL